MATKIMISAQHDNAIQTMCFDSMIQAVNTLADKYGFDAEEARREFNLDDIKIVHNKRVPADKKEKEEKKAKRAARKEANKDKPKRKPTGYMLFSQNARPETKALMEAALTEGEKLMSKLVTVELGKQWTALEQSVKAEWNAKAKGDDVEEDAGEDTADSDSE